MLQQTGPAGDLLIVLDEKAEPVKDAVVWLDGRKLTRDEKIDRILVPFTKQPGRGNWWSAMPRAHSPRSAISSITPKKYQLDAQFHIDREQLLARREATLAVRTSLMLGESQLDPALFLEPKLTITSTTLDGISTTREVKNLKLSAGSVLPTRSTCRNDWRS